MVVTFTTLSCRRVFWENNLLTFPCNYIRNSLIVQDKELKPYTENVPLIGNDKYMVRSSTA